MGRFKAHSIAKNKELLYAAAVVVSNLVLKQNKEAVKRNQYGGRD